MAAREVTRPKRQSTGKRIEVNSIGIKTSYAKGRFLFSSHGVVMLLRPNEPSIAQVFRLKARMY
jgi:hypothetical protein